MRSEGEMLKMIMDIAVHDEGIRGVFINGSRTDPHAKKDIFQDYDIVYVVRSTKTYRDDENWIDRFGPRLYMQKPEDLDQRLNKPVDIDACYGWLIQLADGNRLDLHVETPDQALKTIAADHLCRILLDKDDRLPALPPASDCDHYVERPNAAVFAANANEFWWCLNNVAKGMWRSEPLYVMDMLDQWVRPCLFRELTWLAALPYDFGISVGKAGKYLARYLDQEDYESFLATYSSTDEPAMWEAIIIMAELFDAVSRRLAQQMEFAYDQQEARASFDFLKHVRDLPKTASSVF